MIWELKIFARLRRAIYKSIYDDVVEKRLLSNTFFTNTLPVLEPLAYGDARRVFHDHMTSAEAWEKTAS